MSNDSGPSKPGSGADQTPARRSRGRSGFFDRLPLIGGLLGGADASGAGDAAELEARVAVPIMADWVAKAEWREIARGFTALADEGLWMSLLDRLRGVDQSRQQFASGRRYFDCALSGALYPVTRHLGANPRIDAALEAVSQYAILHGSDTRDYMPAVLLARALNAVAWSIRGPYPPDDVAPQAAAAAAVYFSRAEAAIEPFDPIEENSPMIAEARYLLIPGIEGGEKFLRDWYEDWADLDPSNPTMLYTHSAFLMPNWFGDLDEIEVEARRAAMRADDGLGSGAYAHFWRAPLEIDPMTVGKINPDLFLAGIHRALTHSPCQGLVNEFAALLFRLSLPRSTERRDNVARAATVRERLADGFEDVVRRHMQEAHIDTWGMDEMAIRRALAGAFATDYAAGATIRPGGTGLVAELPKGPV